ncbi:DUF7576 family protein [Halohasta litorea]|uniref:DUF7576 family protein n=1 Tax=Halohasta litorea TaxID=869891 RepID=UPI003CCD97F6
MASENPDQEVVDPTECATCGKTIDPSAWHPVATLFDDEGDFHLFTFCSVICRNRWVEK